MRRATHVFFPVLADVGVLAYVRTEALLLRLVIACLDHLVMALTVPSFCIGSGRITATAGRTFPERSYSNTTRHVSRIGCRFGRLHHDE